MSFVRHDVHTFFPAAAAVGFAVLAAWPTFTASRSVLHELAGLVCFLIAAILGVGAVTAAGIFRLRTDYRCTNGADLE
jgi:hypothetical protein